jgi:ADP-ribose pyrophosphatase
MTALLSERQRQALADYQEMIARYPQLFTERRLRRLVLDPAELAAYTAEHDALLGVSAATPYLFLLNDLVESRAADGTALRYPYLRLVSRPQLLGGVNVVIIAAIADPAIGRLGDIVLVEQERHATGRTEIELPRGFGEPGLGMADNALKELREETGYIGGEVRDLGAAITDSGLMDTEVHFLYGPIVGRISRVADPREAITETRLLPADEIWSAIRAGRIRDSFTIQAMALLNALGPV